LGFKYEKSPAPMPYWTQKDTAGGLMNDEKPYWLPYISVDVVAARVAKAEKLGGKVLMPRKELPAGPPIGMFQDPEGHVIGLVEEEANAA